MAEDINQASMFAALCFQNFNDDDKIVVEKVLESNWSTEDQMVSNLLQYPFLIPSHLQFKFISQALDDYASPYYILSAAVGLHKIKVKDIQLQKIIKQLKAAVLCEYGTVAMRAFIALQPFLKYPDDVDFFTTILNNKKNPLQDTSISWLVLNVKDKNELLQLLKTAKVNNSHIQLAETKMDEHCSSLAKGEHSCISIELFDYIPNLNDFDAMLEKEDTLSDFFDDLDTDKDEKLSAEEVKTFLQDIGEEVEIQTLINDMKSIGIDGNGKLDKDGFIEMMFPKFQIQ